MPTRVERHEIKWQVLQPASACLAAIRAAMTPAEYEDDKAALQEFLCNYFSTGDCQHKQGKAQISPMKSTFTAVGGKCLKVRWGALGCGKSGGLRLAVVVHCDTKLVKIAGAWNRKDDPSDADFETVTTGV